MSPKMIGNSERSLYSSQTTKLVALCIYTIGSSALLWMMEGLPTVVRIPLALPILLFAPGYALVSALVPSRPERTGIHRNDTETSVSSVSSLERLLLAVVTSVALVPMAAVAVNAIVGIQLGATLAVIAGITVLGSAVGILRSRSGSVRTDNAPNRRTRNWRRALTDPLTIVAIILTVALLGSSAALVAVDPGDETLETEFYVADNESETNSTDEAMYSLRIAQDDVPNQQYTVVVTASDSETDAAGTELHRFSTTVSAGETAESGVQIFEPDLESDAMVRFLLYRGDAPDSPDPDSAHRVIRQSVNETG